MLNIIHTGGGGGEFAKSAMLVMSNLNTKNIKLVKPVLTQLGGGEGGGGGTVGYRWGSPSVGLRGMFLATGRAQNQRRMSTTGRRTATIRRIMAANGGFLTG